MLHEEISITLVRGVPRGSTQSIYKQLKRGEGKNQDILQDSACSTTHLNSTELLGLTSVPYLAMAALASCRIFSLYIWAARLLYLALASVVVQPCWRKKAVWKEKNILSPNCYIRLKRALDITQTQQKKEASQRQGMIYWAHSMNQPLTDQLCPRSLPAGPRGLRKPSLSSTGGCFWVTMLSMSFQTDQRSQFLSFKRTMSVI